MKKIIHVFVIVAIFASCASVPVDDASSYYVNSTETQVPKISEDTVVPSDIFDILQRPLGHTVSPQLLPATRKSFEYYTLGLDLWDIYIMLGKKIGSGIFEKTIQIKGDCNIIELQIPDNDYKNAVTSVFLIFSSLDKNILEKLRSDFSVKATDFLGRQGRSGNASTIIWEAGLIQYASYSIKKHEDGNWIYIINSYYMPSDWKF